MALIRWNLQKKLKTSSDGANANTARDFRGPYPAHSPLFAALYSGGQPDIVVLLVRAGADVNARYTGISSTNMAQLSAGQRLLLSAKEATENKQSKEFFPLYYAAGSGNPRTVEILLEAGADANARGGARSHAIFNTYDIEIAKLLIKYGADINTKNYQSETVLAHAKQQLRDLNPGHYLRPKIEAYLTWLSSQGARD